MDYNKNSFLAGLAVGRRLKGWAGGVDAQLGGKTILGIIYDNPTFSNTGKVLTAIKVISGETLDYIEEA